MHHFHGHCRKEHSKGNGRTRINWESKKLLDLYYANDFSTLDENVSELNEFIEVLRAQGTRIGLKINVKKLSR